MNTQDVSLEEALTTLYQRIEPEPDFAQHLENKLLALEFRPDKRPPLSIWFKQGLQAAGLIAAVVLLILLFTWAVNNLIARPVPGGMQAKTASPTISQASTTPSLSTPAPTKSPRSKSPILYTVKSGDTLLSIADESDMPVEIIAALNNIKVGAVLTPGTELVVGFDPPVPMPAKELLVIDPISSSSNSDEIRRCMQSSAATWNTLWADALLTSDSKGEQHVDREQVWLQEGASRWVSGGFGAKPSLLWIEREGKSALVDLQSGEVQQMELAGRIPSQLENLLLPTKFSVRGGEFRPFKVETIAGRETVAVEWSNDEKRLIDRFWIDVEHCVILKWVHLPQEFADAGGKIVPAEVMITAIVFDGQFSPTLFDQAASYPLDFAADFDAP